MTGGLLKSNDWVYLHHVESKSPRSVENREDVERSSIEIATALKYVCTDKIQLGLFRVSR